MLFSRILSFITPLISAGFVILAHFWPSNFYYFAIIVLLLNVLTIWRFFKTSGHIKHHSIFFAANRIFALLFGFFGAAILVENFPAIFIGAVLLGIFLWLFYGDLFFYLFRDFNDEAVNKKIFRFNVLEIAAIFGFAIILMGLQDFLSYSLWWFCFSALIFFYWADFSRFFAVGSISKKEVLLKALIPALILMEIMLTVWILPPVYYVKAALFTLFYAIFASFNYGADEILTTARRKFYLIIGIAGAILLLITARWF